MSKNEIDNLDPKSFIIIKGAAMHNLKEVDVAIPRNKLVVISGLSGSGKSSLAFDTLYAEGQRRYVESLSAYARQFMGRFDKPKVEYIKGISPAIAIEQKVISRNPRSTVGTVTEVYDYIKLLFARIGKTYSPISDEEVTKDTVDTIFNKINEFELGTKAMLSAPISNLNQNNVENELSLLLQKGFSRILLNHEVVEIKTAIESKRYKDYNKIELLVDRFVINHEEDNLNRIADSIETAFFEGKGAANLIIINKDKTVLTLHFSNKFSKDGIDFQEPDVHFFSFNNPVGACKTCEGFGSVLGINPDLVIPDKSLSIYDDAVVCWKGDVMSEWKNSLIRVASKFDFPIHRPYFELTDSQKEVLWNGNKYFSGINAFFDHLEEKTYKIQYRVMLARYRGKTKCSDCKGTRLRKDAQYVKINQKSITDLVLMPIDDLSDFFEQLRLSDYEKAVAQRLMIEITNRLNFLKDVGLGYLTLNRQSATLSGGESQRINLATSLGSSLVGSIYILDEPSIGLHSRDTQQLIGVLKSLRNLGNTVIVVEHDEEIMEAADELIDLGPEAGSLGGELVFQGDWNDLYDEKTSLTAQYLTGKLAIDIPIKRRNWSKKIHIQGARENNLKNIDVDIPLQCLVCVTGVSGSGKSSLINKILYPALKRKLGMFDEFEGDYSGISGDIKAIEHIEFINQNPIGKSSRSNPVTYVKAYDDIRSLYAKQKLSKMRNFKAGNFSFNVEGGRCENCKGDGSITIEMQFMADIELSCDVCNGKRFKDEILEVCFQDKNIYELLSMTIDEAIVFFNQSKNDALVNKILEKLLPLQEVGLGYVSLGQSNSTLSGGEAQRIKLASFLIQGSKAAKSLFIFDEPTTGLHFHDVKKLMIAFERLLKLGHSLVVIEHNLDVVKCADWVLDLGPEGGVNGGNLVFAGTPEDLAECKSSYTAKFLQRKLGNPSFA